MAETPLCFVCSLTPAEIVDKIMELQEELSGSAFGASFSAAVLYDASFAADAAVFLAFLRMLPLSVLLFLLSLLLPAASSFAAAGTRGHRCWRCCLSYSKSRGRKGQKSQIWA